MRSLFATSAIAVLALVAAGCSSTGLRSALGTAKNPWETFSAPPGTGDGSRRAQSAVNPFILANYQILKDGAEAFQLGVAADETDIRRYMAAGFALADHYCSDFFRDADESFRRRRFGRSLTNDVGGIVNAILLAAGAGVEAVGAVSQGFTGADSAWRNYDDAFMVDRNLANLRGLVLDAQDGFRARTLGTGDGSILPGDYGTAQSAIRRYAEFCSTLGMQSLLTTSVETARRQQATATEAANRSNENQGDQGRQGQNNGQRQPSTPQAQPPLGTLPLTSNKPPELE